MPDVLTGFGPHNEAVVARHHRLFALAVVLGACISSGGAVSAADPPAFTAVDLGTLGGTTSWAWDISDAGQAVGMSLTGDGKTRAFSWTQADGMIDLGHLGLGYSRAEAVNESGQVVGMSWTTTGAEHAFSWTEAGGMVDLGTLGGTTSRAIAVNERGQVVGYGDTGTGAWHALSWTQAGGMVDLGTLGGTTSRAVAVNDGGQVVGWAETAAGQTHAFSWTEAGGMIDLGELGFGQGSGAVALNDRSIVDLRFPPVLHFNPGQVAGTSHGGTMSHAFSWTENSGMVDLGTLGGARSEATAISAGGQIVGISDTGSPDADEHAFSWTEAGGMIDLGDLGFGSSRAEAVNDSGQVVGWSLASTGVHPFSWTQAGSLVDLGTLGGSEGHAWDVNAKGQVLGDSRTAAGAQHATVWNPPAGGIALPGAAVSQPERTIGTSRVRTRTVRTLGRTGQRARPSLQR